MSASYDKGALDIDFFKILWVHEDTRVSNVSNSQWPGFFCTRKCAWTKMCNHKNSVTHSHNCTHIFASIVHKFQNVWKWVQKWMIKLTIWYKHISNSTICDCYLLYINSLLKRHVLISTFPHLVMNHNSCNVRVEVVFSKPSGKSILAPFFVFWVRAFKFWLLAYF